MKVRHVDRAYNWLLSQPRRPHHYRDEVWTALAEDHPDELGQTEERKTPWYSLHRDMSEDERFVRREQGMFELAVALNAESGEDAALNREDEPEPGEEPIRSARTPMTRLQEWVLEALRDAGGTAKLTDIIARLEATKALTVKDRQPQPGHERESSFAYRSRWAVTRLRKEGLLKSESPKGKVELLDRSVGESVKPPETVNNSVPTRQSIPTGERHVWLFQANPKYYRILEALQSLDRLTFLTNRYRDAIAADDVVLLWMSGKHAGIYAQARVVEGVELRGSIGSDADFWAEPSAGDEVKPRVVLAVERRYLGNPVLKTRIVTEPGLENLMILRQPNGTNFRVTDAEWAVLQPLLPTAESREPDPDVLTWAMRSARGGKLYDQSCGDLLELYVAEHFALGQEHSRGDIAAWFRERYPLLKPITVQCHVEKYTTNFRSRVHYNAGPEHDLLFREDDDWSRLRLYQSSVDPEPIHQLDDDQSASTGRSAAARKAWDTRRKRGATANGAPVDRHRRLLHHLAAYGELTALEQNQLAVDDLDVAAWLDSLLVARPRARIVSPLFLSLIEGDPSPLRFTTQLAVRLMGHHVERAVKQPLESIEPYVWERFGSWRLPQPHQGDEKWHGYLALPAAEPADKAASERLDLFSRLPSVVIGELVREPGFLAEQQQWSAQAAGKTDLGALSRQLKLGVRRPLFLSTYVPHLGHEECLRPSEVSLSDVLIRSHVVAGVPLFTPVEWEEDTAVGRDVLASRLLEHPLHAAIVQFEVQRLMARLSGEAEASLREPPGGPCMVDVAGSELGPLWKLCRDLLAGLAYWPVGSSTADALWASSVDAALANLVEVGVLAPVGGTYRLTESFSSELKAHPGHAQNRGEKPFRARLSQFLVATQGDRR